MVNKEIISKSINDAILKCNDGYTLNKKVQKSFREFAESVQGKFNDNEKAIIVDENGKILSKRNGGVTSVSWDLGELSLLYEGHGDLYPTHSHPNWNKSDFPTCLSEADLKIPFATDEYGDYMIKCITAEDTYNGSSMTVIRGESFEKWHDNDALMKANKQLNKSYSKTLKKYRDNLQKEWDKSWKKHGSPSVDDSNYDEIYNQVTKESSMNAFVKSNFEKEFKKVQELYKNANCRLKLDWRNI